MHVIWGGGYMQNVPQRGVVCEFVEGIQVAPKRPCKQDGVL